MQRDPIRKAISYIMVGLLSILIMLILFSCVAIELTKKSPEEIDAALKENRTTMKLLFEGKPLNPNLPDPWPPNMNQTYPEIELIDQTGERLFLSDLTDQILIIEYIDMMSPVSQAQSGAGIMGPYAGGRVDEYAQEISDVVRKQSQGKFRLPDEKVTHVKIIVYGENGGQASRDDAQNWADHFNLTRDKNVIVAVPVKDITGEKSASLIGGYQLVDRNFFLRVDSSGIEPKHSMQMTLAPMLVKLAR